MISGEKFAFIDHRTLFPAQNRSHSGNKRRTIKRKDNQINSFLLYKKFTTIQKSIKSFPWTLPKNFNKRKFSDLCIRYFISCEVYGNYFHLIVSTSAIKCFRHSPYVLVTTSGELQNWFNFPRFALFNKQPQCKRPTAEQPGIIEHRGKIRRGCKTRNQGRSSCGNFK